MKDFFEKIKPYYQVLVLIVVVVGIVWQFNGIKVDAAEAKDKVDTIDETLVQMTQLAQSLADPNDWLKKYFITKGIDLETAKEWSSLPRKVWQKKDGTYSKIPFINPSTCPELGIYQKYVDSDNIKILDTIWNFQKKE